MILWRLGRILAAVMSAGLLSACIPAPQPQPTPDPVPEAAQAPQAAAPQPAPEPLPTLPPAEPIRAAFTFAGELEQGGWIRGRVPSNAAQVMLGDEPVTFDEAGFFFAAFDRDAGSTVSLLATLDNGQQITQTLAIKPRSWNIERVNVARRRGGASASFMARRQPELDAIWNARLQRTGSNGWQQDFIWPVKGRISGRFGSQRIYRGEPGSYHTGIDIAPGNGVPFVAPADGVVVLVAQNFSLEGKLLIIDHGAGLNSAFLHASKLVVAEGERVQQGQYIGNIGSSGRATGPHLHWGLKWGNSRLDPLLFTGPMN